MGQLFSFADLYHAFHLSGVSSYGPGCLQHVVWIGGFYFAPYRNTYFMT